MFYLRNILLCCLFSQIFFFSAYAGNFVFDIEKTANSVSIVKDSLKITIEIVDESSKILFKGNDVVVNL